MEKRIFISHSSKDAETASIICEALEKNDMKCWIAPRDIPYGKEWAGEISKAITNSSAFLFLSSGHSNSSSQVSREIQLAIENQVPIIPIRLDGTEYSDTNKYYLATIHCMFQYDAAKIAKLASDISEAIPKPKEEKTKEKSDKKVPKKPRHILRLCISGAWLWLCTVLAAFLFFFSGLEFAAKTATAVAAIIAGLIPLFIIRIKAIKSFIVNRKTVNILFSIALLGAIGLSAGSVALDNYLWTSDMEHKYRIILTPPEGMSVSEFRLASDTVKARMNILADGQKYTLKNNGDEIELIVPFEIFGELTATDALKCYISRAAKLYLTTNNMINGTVDPTVISVTPDDIESVQILKGKIPGEPEVSEKNVLDTENYEYIEVVLKEDFIKSNKKIIDTLGDDIVFAQDKVEIQTSYYYYNTFKGEKDGVFYILNDDRHPTLNEVLINNMTTEHPAGSLLVKIDGAADWENSSEGATFGENQKNYADIKGDTVCISYRGSIYGEISDGEWIDTVASLKKRLDAFGSPYALGYGINDPHLIVVKMGPDKLNYGVFSLISSSGLTINAGYTNSSIPTSYSDEKCVVLTDSDSTPALKITAPSETYNKLFENLCKAAELAGKDEIYIVCRDSEMPILSAKAKAADNFVFTCLAGAEQNSSWLPALALAIYENDLAVNLSFESYSTGDSDITFDKTFLSDEVCKKIEDTYPVKSIEEDGGDLQISFDFTVDEKLPENVISASKNIYELIDFENSIFSSVSLYFITEQGEERCRVFFRKNFASMYSDGELKTGYPYAHGIFQGGRIERDHQAFLDLIEKDEFFQKLNHLEDGSLFFD